MGALAIGPFDHLTLTGDAGRILVSSGSFVTVDSGDGAHWPCRVEEVWLHRGLLRQFVFVRQVLLTAYALSWLLTIGCLRPLQHMHCQACLLTQSCALQFLRGPDIQERVQCDSQAWMFAASMEPGEVRRLSIIMVYKYACRVCSCGG